MNTLIVLIALLVVTLCIALFIAIVEAGSGPLGDCSMVPGILLVGGIVCFVIATLGLVVGNWSVTFN